MGRTKEEPKDDKLPPHSIEAEQGVIGCVLLSPEECMAILTSRIHSPKVFYDLRHRRMWETLAWMYEFKQKIDLITFQQRLKDLGQLDSVGGLAHVASLPDSVPSAANLEYYVTILEDKFKRRRVLETCSIYIDKAQNEGTDTKKLVEQFGAESLKISEGISGDVDWSIREALLTTIDTIETESKRAEIVTGIPTGFVHFDTLTRGLQKDENFVVIAARPNVGKSTLVMNMVDHIAVNIGLPVGVFSLEMKKPSLLRRMLSARARVNLRHMVGDTQDMFALQQLTDAAGKLMRAPLYIDATRRITEAQIRARMQRMINEHGIQVAVIDYLQRIQSSRQYGKRSDDVSFISDAIKTMQGEFGIPIIVCAQLNRETDKNKGGRPKVSELRESGDIEADADIIGLLYQKDADDHSKQATRCILHLAKNRNGPRGEVELDFLKDITRFRTPLMETK